MTTSTEEPTGTPPKHSGKAKRTLTPGNFFRTVARVAASSPVLFRAFIRPKLSFALREKVFLAVTAINDCRFCAWGHTHWAMAHGVPLEEVNEILGHQNESMAAKDPAEAAAMLFAQHYAEYHDKYDPASIENLRQYFSDAQVKEILAYVRFITLTNLSGNTVDAVLDRLRGKGQPISFFQGVMGLALAPVLFAVILAAKIEQKLGLAKLRARLHRPRAENGEPK
ncbi:carboxymuconolactone decarboxylase family protein [Urbifossiella limnaea]|uniref:carboxymuconolactone decarboxylase family protein n=1 Tax=Urbifossiella limnaea TaxID=2528023 RepID=UPI00192E6D2E|nr:carboxymuconolactone decarboxylase family protein [Urbifossiella limnaea]